LTLPTPYYQDDAVCLYHGDCREILPDLPLVDLVLTDPPFGCRRPSQARPVPFDEVEGNDQQDGSWLLLVSINDPGGVYCFCTWDSLQAWRESVEGVARVRSCVVWDKGSGGMADIKTCWAPRHELILFGAVGRYEFSSPRPSDVLRVNRVPAQALVHPYEKPVGLMTAVLASSPGAVVLDPFAGVGPVLRAAKDLGRKAIGIEIEERYCEIAARRMAQEVLF